MSMPTPMRALFLVCVVLLWPAARAAADEAEAHYRIGRIVEGDRTVRLLD